MKKSLFWMLAILLGSSLAFAQIGFAQTGTQAYPQMSSAPSTTDSNILSQIQSNMAQDSLLGNSRIEIFSNAGNVTLNGMVPNAQAKNEAIRVAKEVPGVKSVNDNLLVSQELQSQTGSQSAQVTTPQFQSSMAQRQYSGSQRAQLTTDAAILSDIQSRMAQDSTLANSKIQVFSNAGNVTLNGFVPSAQAENQAVSVARQVPGVKGVTDNLMVTPEMAAAMAPGSQVYTSQAPMYGQGGKTYPYSSHYGYSPQTGWDNFHSNYWGPQYGIAGAMVKNPQGDVLGTVVDTTADAKGDTNFLIVQPNIPGMEGKYVAIPYYYPAFSMEPGSQTQNPIVVDVSRDTLANAPTIRADQWPNNIRSRWATDSFRYFSEAPRYSE